MKIVMTMDGLKLHYLNLPSLGADFSSFVFELMHGLCKITDLNM